MAFFHLCCSSELCLFKNKKTKQFGYLSPQSNKLISSEFLGRFPYIQFCMYRAYLLGVIQQENQYSLDVKSHFQMMVPDTDNLAKFSLREHVLCHQLAIIAFGFLIFIVEATHPFCIDKTGINWWKMRHFHWRNSCFVLLTWIPALNLISRRLWWLSKFPPHLCPSLQQKKKKKEFWSREEGWWDQTYNKKIEIKKSKDQNSQAIHSLWTLSVNSLFLWLPLSYH